MSTKQSRSDHMLVNKSRPARSSFSTLKMRATAAFALLCLAAVLSVNTSARPTQSLGSASFWGVSNYVLSLFGYQDDKGRRPLPSPDKSEEGLAPETRTTGFIDVASAVPCAVSGNPTINVPNAPGAIQAAINAADPLGGDTLQLAAGTYTEQFVVNKCLTIKGSGVAATFIQSPAALTASPTTPTFQAIVEIRANSYVTMSDLTVTGPVPFTNTVHGIYVGENGQLKFTDGRVTGIHASAGITGAQGGTNVRAGTNAFNQIGTLDFTNVTIDDYQKTGILVDRLGSSLTLTGGTIQGVGPTTAIAQNGIQVSRRASATITNTNFSGNNYTPGSFASTGVLPFNATSIGVSGSTFTGNDVGIYGNFTTADPVAVPIPPAPAFSAVGNTLTTHGFDAIFAMAATTTITDNNITAANVGIGAYPVNGNTVNILRNSVTLAAGAGSEGIHIGNFDNGNLGNTSPTTTAVIGVHFNQISGNAEGLRNNSASAVNAENNFWGCNAGPGNAGCDTVAGTILPDADPWLTLTGIQAVPATVNYNGASAVSGVSLRINSNLANTFSGPGTHVRDGITVSYATAPGTAGTITGSGTGTFAAGLVTGSTTFTAGPGPFVGNQTETVSATLNNEADDAAITVLDTTVPTVVLTANGPNPTGTDPVTFTAVFSEPVSGLTIPDIDTTGTTAPGASVTSVVSVGAAPATTWTITVSGMTNTGAVSAKVSTGTVSDTAVPANTNSASNTASVGYFNGALELVVDETGVNCLANGAPVYTSIQAAVAAASTNYIIRVCDGTYPNQTVNVPIALAGLSVVKAVAAKPVVNLVRPIGNQNSFTISAAGVTFSGIEFHRTDVADGAGSHVFTVQGTGFTAQNNDFISDTPWSGGGVSRVFEVSSTATGLTIQNNTVTGFRQPAYINGDGVTNLGSITGNSVSGSKGWIMAGAIVSFTGNTFGYTCPVCSSDVSIFADASVPYQAYWSGANALNISTANDNAYLDLQFTGAADSGRAVTFVDDGPIALSDGRTAAQALSGVTSIQSAIDSTLIGGTVNILAGTYSQEATVGRTVKVVGAGAASTTVSGPIGGASAATFTIQANNIDISGLTITRDGNAVATWNDPNLNITGITIQGLTLSGAVIHDNVFTGNRTGIDVNASGGHTIRNNRVDFNRTGLIFRNQTDSITFVENEVTNNWTGGIVFLDASVGSNIPVQTARDSAFINNNISGNWYAGIVDRQTGGSLPAPGGSLKNFQGNWFGTATPAVVAVNSTEPGYAAQIPVLYGGTATPPGGQPDIAGPASANVRYNLPLTSGTDTNVETTATRGTFGFQGSDLDVNSAPVDLSGWFFFNEGANGTGEFELGPAPMAPLYTLGAGSARLSVDATGRESLGTLNYGGIRLDRITSLKYSSYQRSDNAAVAPALTFDVKSDITNPSTAYEGRLVFEPYQTPGNVVLQDTWQPWDAMAGRWWGSTGPGSRPITVACPQALPCDWSQILTLFPNAAIRPVANNGALIFRAGGPVNFDMTGYVDKFEIGISTGETVVDFESDGTPEPTIVSIVREDVSPTTDASVDYIVTFSEPVANVDMADFALTTTGVTGTSITGVADYPALPTPPDGTKRKVTVNTGSGSGTIRLDTAAGATIADISGNAFVAVPAYTGGDVYVIDRAGPTVTIDQAVGQADPTSVSPINFTVTFNEDVTDFDDAADIILGGTAGPTTVNITGGPAVYNVAVSGMTGPGFVTATVAASAAEDGLGNLSNASTSTDNTVFYTTGSTVLMVDDDGLAVDGNCHSGVPNSAYMTIQAAVAAAAPGNTIKVCSGAYTAAPTVTIGLANLTIIAAEPTKPVVSATGSTTAFQVNAAGVTLKNLEIVKVGTVTQHVMVGVTGNNFTGDGNYIHGPDWQAPDHVSRGFLVSPGLTGLLITGNTIENIRQPAYIDANGANIVGAISNNVSTGTKGWVVAEALLNFTGNTFGQTCPACGADIAIIDGDGLPTPANPAVFTHYGNYLALSTNNDNAYISVQIPVNPSPSGRAVTYVDDTAAVFQDGRLGQPRLTVQAGVDNTLPGGTVNVAAGSYAENLVVGRALNILGPNEAINPNTGSRVAEAVLVPATSDPVNPAFGGPIVVTLGADGVTLRGLTVDGNNPALTSGVVFNGVDVDAEFGIYGTETANPNAVVTNNIIKNMGEMGVWITSNSQGGVKNNLSLISANKVDNIQGAFGEAIRIGEDAWLDVTNNVVTRSRIGITIENYSGNTNSHPASVISNNTISTYRIGIWHNLHYVYGGGGFTISNNAITSYVQSPAPISPPVTFQGIRVESIQQTVAVTVSGNTLTGNRATLGLGGYTRIDGLTVTNASSTSPNIVFSGNTVSEFMRGAYNDNSPTTPLFTCNELYSNTWGMFIPVGSGGLTATDNDIVGNDFGVQNNAVAPVNADSNFWGAANGPGPVGPGLGDKVSAGVTFAGFDTTQNGCSPAVSYPTVTINQAVLPQDDPTNDTPVNFTATFSEAVTGFTSTDVRLTGTAGATTAAITGGPTVYNVAVSGMTGNGTVIADIYSGGGLNGLGIPSIASTSTDNSVLYDATAPTVLSIVRNDPSPTVAASVTYTVTFSEPVLNVGMADFALTTTGAITGASITSVGAGTDVYVVTVNTGTLSGTIRLDLTAGATIEDPAGNAFVGPYTAGEVYTVDRSTTTTINCAPGSFVYTGSAIMPCSFTTTNPVTGTVASGALLAGEYTNNIVVGTANASHTFVATPTYETSTGSTTFAITLAPSTTVVTCPVSVVYNSNPQTPCTVSVTGAGGLSLTPPATYLNNTFPGTATASYNYPGDANHSGSSDSKNFQIVFCPTVSIPTGQTTLTGVEVTIPVNTTDIAPNGNATIIGADFIMTFDPTVLDPAVGTITVDPGVVDPGASILISKPAVNQLKVSIVSVVPFGQGGLPDSGTIANIKMQVIGDIGETTTLALSNVLYNNVTVCTSTSNGDLSILSGTVTGNVSYSNAVVPFGVPNVSLTGVPTPSGTPAFSVTTIANGNYLLSNFGPGEYNVTPSRAPQSAAAMFPLPSGIKTNDAALIAQHVVGLTTLTGPRLEAAKVSGLPTVSSFEAALVAQWIVGIPNVLNQTGQWKFTPVSRNYPNVNANQTAQNYAALLMGDVNGDWAASASRPAPLAAPNKETVIASVPDMQVAQGSQAVVPLRIDNLLGKGVTSYQFEIGYDPSVIEPAQVAADITGTLSQGLMATANVAEPGVLRVAVFGVMPAMGGDGVYVNLRFSVLGGVGSASQLDISGFWVNDRTVEVFANSGRVMVANAASGSVIRGHLTTAAGKPVRDTRVVLRDTSGATTGAMSDASGQFEFANLASGAAFIVSVPSRVYRFKPVQVTTANGASIVNMVADQ